MTTQNRSLEERLAAPAADAWKPQPGGQLVGIVVDVDVRDAGHGDYPVLTVEQEDGGALAWHAFHDVARRELAKARPQLGERIGIAYLGRAAGERRYHRWRVLKESAAMRAVDWDRFADEADVPASDVPADLAPPARVPADEPAARDDLDDLPF